MKKVMVTMALMLAFIATLSAQALDFTDSTVTISKGLGEFQNKQKVHSYQVEGVANLNSIVHLTAKLEKHIAQHGATDDAAHSLINRDTFWLGGGLHYLGSSITGLVSKDWWEVEVKHQTEPLYWGVYRELGLRHKNIYGQGRKTDSAFVGLGKKLGPHFFVQGRYEIGNNTAVYVDDMLYFGLGAQL